MKPLDGDPDLLLRAGRRCGQLAAELHTLELRVARASTGGGSQWAGAAAALFGARTTSHRRTVADARRATERLGSITTAFGHELADAQARARAADDPTAVEEELTLQRNRFRSRVRSVSSDLTGLLLQLEGSPFRTGPIMLPGGLGRLRRQVPSPPLLWGHHRLPPLAGPDSGVETVRSDRWTGPVKPPPGVVSKGVPLPGSGRWTGPPMPPWAGPKRPMLLGATA